MSQVEDQLLVVIREHDVLSDRVNPVPHPGCWGWGAITVNNSLDIACTDCGAKRKGSHLYAGTKGLMQIRCWRCAFWSHMSWCKVFHAAK